MTLPDALPPLPRPEVGHHFSDRDKAWDRARELDANVLSVARTALAECYARVAKLRAGLLNPLPGQRSPAATATAAVLAGLMDNLISSDADTTGLALSQIDEAFGWQDVPDEEDQPLFSFAYSCAPHPNTCSRHHSS